MRPPPWRGVGSRAFSAQLVVAIPPRRPYRFQAKDGEQVSNTKGVIIVFDRHKMSATIAVVDANERVRQAPAGSSPTGGAGQNGS